MDAPDPLTISNEFAVVRVLKAVTRNGERLEISSVRSDYSVMLDATALEALTWQEPEFFSGLVSNFLWAPLDQPPGGEPE